MALLTDGNPNDAEALRVYETAILDVAHVETIDLDAKLGLATEEISQEVLEILLGHTPLSYAPAYDYQGSVRRRLGVSDVVVTPQIKRWHALRSLEVIYRDAYNNQLNDRYRAKWDEYRELSRGAKVRAITFGIGLVSKPLPRALGPVIGVTAGPILATTYYVRIGWVSAAGQEGNTGTGTTYQNRVGKLVSGGTTKPPARRAGRDMCMCGSGF